MPTAAAVPTSCGSRLTRCSDRVLTRGIAMRAAIAVPLPPSPPPSPRSAADVPRRRRPRPLQRHRRRQAGCADHRPDGRRLRARRRRQAAGDHLLPRRVSRRAAISGAVLPLHLGLALDTSGSMEDDIHDVRTGDDQVRQRQRARGRHDAGRLRHRGAAGALQRRRLPAPDRAHPDAEAGWLDGVLRRGRRVSERRRRTGRREDPAHLHRRRRHAQLDDLHASSSTC